VSDHRAPSFSDWIADTPWGTTRPGLAARLVFPAGVTWVVTVCAPRSPGGFSNIFLAVLAAAMWTCAYVIPWLFERYMRSAPIVERRTDRALLGSSVVASLLALLSLWVLQSASVAVVIGVAQTLWIGVAFLQGRPRRGAEK
jgi:hypothetical protein